MIFCVIYLQYVCKILKYKSKFFHYGNYPLSDWCQITPAKDSQSFVWKGAQCRHLLPIYDGRSLHRRGMSLPILWQADGKLLLQMWGVPGKNQKIANLVWWHTTKKCPPSKHFWLLGHHRTSYRMRQVRRGWNFRSQFLGFFNTIFRQPDEAWIFGVECVLWRKRAYHPVLLQGLEVQGGLPMQDGQHRVRAKKDLFWDTGEKDHFRWWQHSRKLPLWRWMGGFRRVWELASVLWHDQKSLNFEKAPVLRCFFCIYLWLFCILGHTINLLEY